MMTIAKMQMVRGGMKTESPCDKYVLPVHINYVVFRAD